MHGIGKDVRQCLGGCIDVIAVNHLSAFGDEYVGWSVDDVVNHLRSNGYAAREAYVFEGLLQRRLNDKEKDYYSKQFIKAVERHYKLKSEVA